jgi:hypothetical protein
VQPPPATHHDQLHARLCLIKGALLALLIALLVTLLVTVVVVVAALQDQQACKGGAGSRRTWTPTHMSQGALDSGVARALQQPLPACPARPLAGAPPSDSVCMHARRWWLARRRAIATAPRAGSIDVGTHLLLALIGVEVAVVLVLILLALALLSPVLLPLLLVLQVVCLRDHCGCLLGAACVVWGCCRAVAGGLVLCRLQGAGAWTHTLLLAG